MALQSVTVRLPDVLYRRIEQRARQMHRSVEDELVAVVAEALPGLEGLPSDIADELAQLAFLSDEELWQVARATLASEESERTQALLLKRQREGLIPEEQQEAERLLHRYDRVMLVRAQAAMLLKERGYDISSAGGWPRNLPVRDSHPLLGAGRAGGVLRPGLRRRLPGAGVRAGGPLPSSVDPHC